MMKRTRTASSWLVLQVLTFVAAPRPFTASASRLFNIQMKRDIFSDTADAPINIHDDQNNGKEYENISIVCCGDHTPFEKCDTCCRDVRVGCADVRDDRQRCRITQCTDRSPSTSYYRTATTTHRPLPSEEPLQVVSYADEVNERARYCTCHCCDGTSWPCEYGVFGTCREFCWGAQRCQAIELFTPGRNNPTTVLPTIQPSHEPSQSPSEWPSLIPSSEPSEYNMAENTSWPSTNRPTRPPPSSPKPSPNTNSPSITSPYDDSMMPSSWPSGEPSVEFPTTTRPYISTSGHLPTLSTVEESSLLLSMEPSEWPSSFPSTFPSILLTDSPTENSCAAEYIEDCVAGVGTSDIIETFVLIQFDTDVTADMQTELMYRIPLVYDQVAGTVCDACRRQILDYDIVPSTISTGISSKDHVVVKLIIGQSGGCDSAFDTNDLVASIGSLQEFTLSCGDFIPFFVSTGPQSCCCNRCITDESGRRTFLSGGISRHDFGVWLGLNMKSNIMSVMELTPPPENEAACEPQQPKTTSPSFYISLDYTLDPSDYKQFLSLFLSMYNRMCLETCFPQRIESIVSIQDDGVGRRRLQKNKESTVNNKMDMKMSKKTKQNVEQSMKNIGSILSPCEESPSCLKVQVVTKCFSKFCSEQSDASCGLFGQCQSERKLTEGSKIQSDVSLISANALSEPFSSGRLDTVEDSDACLCLTGGDVSQPTFVLPTMEKFLGKFNREIGIGFGIKAIYGEGAMAAADSEPVSAVGTDPKEFKKGEDNKHKKITMKKSDDKSSRMGTMNKRRKV
eukprot:scaffold5139_cov155-Amphora_coffeaeformis.AAC.5